MGRIPASDRTRELLKALKEGKERWAIRARPWCACGPLILEEGLEGEATDAVGREHTHVARLLGRLSRRLPAEDGRGRDRSRCRSDRGCIRRQTEMEEVLLRSAITATWSSACAPAFAARVWTAPAV